MKNIFLHIVILLCFLITLIELIISFLTLSLYQRLFPIGIGGRLLKFIHKSYWEENKNTHIIKKPAK